MLAVVPPVSLGAVGVYLMAWWQFLMKRRPSTQVFYGRYLKRLSNKTQEALGEMTKVGQICLSGEGDIHIGFRLHKSPSQLCVRSKHSMPYLRNNGSSTRKHKVYSASRAKKPSPAVSSSGVPDGAAMSRC